MKKTYALMGTPRGETERRIVGLVQYESDWVDAIRSKGNPKSVDILDFEESEPPAALGQTPVFILVVGPDNVVRRQWSLEPLPVPSVSRFQLRRAIKELNRRAAFLTYITQTASEDDQDYWATVEVIHRAAPEVERLRVSIGVTQNAMNNLFYRAALITS